MGAARVLPGTHKAVGGESGEDGEDAIQICSTYFFVGGGGTK
jgi:hypothetical protein